MQGTAPSDELRRWFNHDPDQWEEFQEGYRREPRDKRVTVENLIEGLDKDPLTLLYGA